MIRFHVPGQPAPKGSPRVVTRGKGGRPLPFPRVLADRDTTKAWQQAVALHARAAMAGQAPIVAGLPLAVSVAFGVHRPARHYGTGRNAGTLRADAPPAPVYPPDVDKLVRTTFDGLIGVVLHDDAQVVALRAVKLYVPRALPAGALVVVEHYHAGVEQAAVDYAAATRHGLRVV